MSNKAPAAQMTQTETRQKTHEQIYDHHSSRQCDINMCCNQLAVRRTGCLLCQKCEQ
ncbi:hypothetical protein [Enterobacter ludwigii]